MLTDDTTDGRRLNVSLTTSLLSGVMSRIEILDLLLPGLEAGSFTDRFSNLSILLWTLRVIWMGLKRSSMSVVPCLLDNLGSVGGKVG